MIFCCKTSRWMLQVDLALDFKENLSYTSSWEVLNRESSVSSILDSDLLLLAFEHIVDELAVHRILHKFFFGDVSVPVFVHSISARHQFGIKVEEE